MPALVIHGDDDQIVPIDAAGRASARMIKNAQLIVYPGAPHGIIDTHKDRLNADLPAFLYDRIPVSMCHTLARQGPDCAWRSRLLSVVDAVPEC